MNRKSYLSSWVAPVRQCVKRMLPAFLLLASILPASSATFDYLGAINTKLTDLYGLTITSPGLQLGQLESAVNQLINNDTKNPADGYVYTALTSSSFNSSAADFALFLANGLGVPTAAAKGAIARGAIAANAALTGSITTVVIQSANGGVVAGDVGLTSTFGSSLIKPKKSASPALTSDQIIQATATFASSSIYPVPATFSSDPRTTLVVNLAALLKDSSLITSVTEGIGQTLDIIYNPQDTIGIPSYNSREYLSHFAANLANQASLSKFWTAVAIGLVNNNPEVAPRICNTMLANAPKIKATSFLQAVATTVDAEEVMEIAAALSLPAGFDSVGVPGVGGSNAVTSPIVPYLTSSNAGKNAPAIALTFSQVLVAKSGTANVVQDVAGVAAIFANKLASFVLPPSDPNYVKSLSTYQKNIVAIASNVVKAIATLSPVQQQAIADAVSGDMTAAVMTVYTNTNLADTKSIYAQIVNAFLKIKNVTATVTASLGGPIFAWGPLNTDETPNTNF